MDKVLTTALLTIAAIVAAVMVVNAVLPALSTGSTAMLSSSQAAAERMKTDIEIIHATSGNSTTTLWVKNVGSTEIQNIRDSDVFVNDELMTFEQGGVDCTVDDKLWSHDDGDWMPSKTLEITVCINGPQSRVRFTTPNGVTDEELING